MFYIYDNTNEEFHYVSFKNFEDAEEEMEQLIAFDEVNCRGCSYDIYEKIT